MEREEAEIEITDAANTLRYVVEKKIEPEWLWDRYKDDLTYVLNLLEDVASGMAGDEP